MGTKDVLSIFFICFATTNALISRKCREDSEYRELDGRCSSVSDPNWGKTAKFLGDYESDPLRRSSPLPSSILAEEPQTQDPVTEWLGAWTSFIKSDLFNIGEDYLGLINVASPVLDLSNLYGTSGDTVNIDPRIIGDNWDMGEKVLWKLLESEHYRLSEELASINQGWGTNKIHQEARKILIAEYQNIVMNEVAPLLLGSRAMLLMKAATSNQTEELSGGDLVLGVNADLAMSASDLNYLQNSLSPLDEIWHDMAFRMLELHLIMPQGGVTMDKLNELSDTLDLLKNLENSVSDEIKRECQLDYDDEYKASRYGERSPMANELLDALLEEAESGAVLSPTMACLFQKVLSKVISGDRFWYSKPTSTLSQAQLTNVRGIKMSSLLCANMPFISIIQPNAFLEVDLNGLNAPVTCSSAAVPDLDIDLWLDTGDFFTADGEMSQEEQVEQAITAAKNRLLEFRRYEYDLYQDNFIAPRGSGLSGLNAVAKPSIQVMNSLNTSTLFELVTYEFLRRPQLSGFIHSKSSTPRKVKRAVGILNTNRVFQITPVNLEFDNKVKTSLKGVPQNRLYYKSVLSTRTIVGPSANREINLSGNRIGNSGELTFEISTRDLNGDGQCDPSEKSATCTEFNRYRSYSGWCNNRNHPDWGVSMSVHKRLLPSEYDDRISSPRTNSVRGVKLPSPRLVSQTVHYNEQKLDPKYTLMLMQWGQFIDHDLTHTPMLRGFHNTILECGTCTSKNVHPACFPITIPENDNYYSFNSRDPKCIPFSRSVFGQETLGPREQINQLTSYLDASMVYGSNECEMRRVRETGTPYLKTFTHPLNTHTHVYKDLLPRTNEHSDCFSPSGQCFMAGDSRVNEQPGLACIHTIMLREHNKVAAKLSTINPHWDVNRVFEETRRIIGAQVQHITYNEFLPRVLGLNNLNLFDLDLRTSGYYEGYDKTCSATTFTEFATAAFRFGHSMITPNITVMSEDAMRGRTLPKEMALRQHFNKPDVLMERDMVDDILRGLTMMPMETTDNTLTDEITNHLFEQKKPKSGLDLASLNIQRGRDHGIPGYNKYRQVCQLKKAQFFTDLKNEMRIEIIHKLQKTYKHPDDIDLFTGLLAETRLPGALTGPTLACLIGLQFKHLRKCDRYWYETSDPDISFTLSQLKELRSTSLAALICSNMDKNSMISRSSMDQMDRLTNPLVDCSQTIKHLDLEKWREEPVVRSTGSSSHIISRAESGSTSHTTVCQIRDQSVLRGNRYRISPCTTCMCTPQGVKCETVNLSEYGSSCLQLVSQFGIKKVEEDDSCRPQCRII